ncbi:hypothetical protein DRO38_03375 [Candidatus Bathyarchaeota archaeon]|nr:MAG: hypothetical protein DRO38_03375 [Candidatus Bathyarchaeota archaeon]
MISASPSMFLLYKRIECPSGFKTLNSYFLREIAINNMYGTGVGWFRRSINVLMFTEIKKYLVLRPGFEQGFTCEEYWLIVAGRI